MIEHARTDSETTARLTASALRGDGKTAGYYAAPGGEFVIFYIA